MPATPELSDGGSAIGFKSLNAIAVESGKASFRISARIHRLIQKLTGISSTAVFNRYDQTKTNPEFQMHEKHSYRGTTSKLSMILVTVVAAGVIGFIIWQLQTMGDPPGSDYKKLDNLNPAEAPEVGADLDPELAKAQEDIEAMVARIDAKMKARKSEDESAEVPISEPVEPAFADKDPATLTPVEQTEPTQSGSKGNLPSMADSDVAVKQDLASIAPEASQLLADEFIVAKTARAIAALSEGKLVNEFRPLKNPLTPFAAEPLNQGFQIASVNSVRYKTYLDVLTSIGSERLVKMYWHYYPLLEESYRELGASEQEFKDVTIAAIDQLLAAPQLSANHVLIHPTVMYKYEDPSLEKLPAAHKLMMRIGSGNRARIEPLLREIRAELNKS